MPPQPVHRHLLSRASLAVIALALCGLLALLTVTPTAGAQDARKLARDGTFEGHWTFRGMSRDIEVNSNPMTAFRFTGPVKIRPDGGMPTQFESYCVGISDPEAGGIGRCRWTDEHGDTIFLVMRGGAVGPVGTSRESSGRIQGGTGRYEGLQGEVEIEWLFLDSKLEEGKILGQDTKMTGHWKGPS